MQINLRKANAIQAEIRRAISSVHAKDAVSITEFTSDVEAVLSRGTLEFMQALQRKEALNKALFQIRKAVGRANVECGISDVLADIESLDAQIAIKNQIANAAIRKDTSEINARIAKMKQSTGERAAVLYGDRYNSVETTVVSENDVATAKSILKTMKRDRQALNDKLLQLNVNTLVELTDFTKLTLQEEGLI